jgi:cbb3-type cytochrome oxidase subunit 3
MIETLCDFAAANPARAFGLAFLVLLFVCALAVRPSRRRI